MSIETALLQILIFPDPRLRKVCATVERFDEPLARLAERLLELMHEAKGIGLAAPQVGVMVRLFVCNVSGKPEDDLVMVNPTLTPAGDTVVSEEGCLSIPDVTVTVTRRSECTVDAFDLSGRPIQWTGEQLVARCWQHECDHLDGRLIIDRMPPADRIANRRFLKQLEAEYARRDSA